MNVYKEDGNIGKGGGDLGGDVETVETRQRAISNKSVSKIRKFKFLQPQLILSLCLFIWHIEDMT